MNLYLISQKENQCYETYDGAVVAAESEEEARNMNPQNGLPMERLDWNAYSSVWCKSIKYVQVKYLGIAGPEIKRGVVFASFCED